jgi:hypothetical protein
VDGFVEVARARRGGSGPIFFLRRTMREHVEAIEGGPIFPVEAACGATGLGRSSN